MRQGTRTFPAIIMHKIRKVTKTKRKNVIGGFNGMQCLGEASVRLKKGVEIISSASVVGTKEGQGPLGALFDKVGKDDSFGAKTWEEAESTLQI